MKPSPPSSRQGKVKNPSLKVAALYVQPGGVYYGLEDVEPWGLPDKDARDYVGPWPVVAHPPCKRWSKIAAVHGVRNGQDDGCFESALHAVESFGGVIEHPAGSMAWEWFGIRSPGQMGWQKTIRGGWTCQVEQGNYGHDAPKSTWLYYYGNDPHGLIWRPSGAAGRIEHMGGGGNPYKRERTPEPFRDLLIQLAKSA